MVLITIPKIFFNIWFWMAIMVVITVIHYFWGKAPPPPKPSKFHAKHKKTMYKICDIFLISVILFCWLPLIYMSISIGALFLIAAIPISGLSGVLIGLLSVFHSNLTNIKKIILLIICLLPVALTGLLLMIQPSLSSWSIIKSGLIASFDCWIINGSAIIIGKHFIRVAWSLLRILKLVSGDYPG